MLNSRSPALTDPRSRTQPAHPCFVLNCLIFRGKTKQGKAVCLPKKNRYQEQQKSKASARKAKPCFAFFLPLMDCFMPTPSGQSRAEPAAARSFAIA